MMTVLITSSHSQCERKSSTFNLHKVIWNTWFPTYWTPYLTSQCPISCNHTTTQNTLMVTEFHKHLCELRPVYTLLGNLRGGFVAQWYGECWFSSTNQIADSWHLCKLVWQAPPECKQYSPFWALIHPAKFCTLLQQNHSLRAVHVVWLIVMGHCARQPYQNMVYLFVKWFETKQPKMETSYTGGTSRYG